MAYYVSGGLHQRWLGVIAAVLVAGGTGVITCMSHVNGVCMAIDNVMSSNALLVGVILAVVSGIIVAGGFKKIASFAQTVVPFMALVYILLALFIIIFNISHVPAVFRMIFQSAFHFRAVGGGILGYTVQQAFRFGMARGIFSNEAGQGTVVNVSSSASVRHPVTQGFLGMAGVFTDTILVCTATGMIILLSGADYHTLTGIALTQAAFSHYFGGAASWILAVALFFFAFTSLIPSIWGDR